MPYMLYPHPLCVFQCMLVGLPMIVMHCGSGCAPATPERARCLDTNIFAFIADGAEYHLDAQTGRFVTVPLP